MQPVDRNIHERGCLRAGEDWLETHLIGVAATVVGLLIMQVQEFYNIYVSFSFICIYIYIF